MHARLNQIRAKLTIDLTLGARNFCLDFNSTLCWLVCPHLHSDFLILVKVRHHVNQGFSVAKHFGGAVVRLFPHPQSLEAFVVVIVSHAISFVAARSG